MNDLMQLPTQVAARFNGEPWSIHEASIPTYLGAMVRGGGNPFAIDLAAVMGAKASAFDREEQGYRVFGKTAVFIADGVFYPDGVSRWGECNTTALSLAFRAAAADASVEDGLLLLNTPGGSTQGQDVLAESQRAFTEKKKLVGQVDQLCCSAGYWLLAQCHEAYAGPRDTIGSIGVRSHTYDWSKYFEELGVKVVSATTGPFKAMGLMGTAITPEQEAFYQDRVEYLFGDFRRDVMVGRKMSAEMFAEIGDGRYWFGEPAVGLGLIDGTRRLSVALAGLTQFNPQPTSTRSRAMAEGANTETKEPQKVTASELKRTFEDSTAEWREEQVEKGATMADAAIAFANHQAKLRKEADEKAKAAEEAAEKAKADAEANANKPQRGTDPVGGGADGGGKVDYHAEAEQLRRDNPGMSYGESLRRMTAKYGEPAMQAFRRGKLPD